MDLRDIRLQMHGRFFGEFRSHSVVAIWTRFGLPAFLRKLPGSINDFWSGQDLTKAALQEMILDCGYLPLPTADKGERNKGKNGKVEN
jgi:hypothetical protein